MATVRRAAELQLQHRGGFGPVRRGPPGVPEETGIIRGSRGMSVMTFIPGSKRRSGGLQDAAALHVAATLLFLTSFMSLNPPPPPRSRRPRPKCQHLRVLFRAPQLAPPPTPSLEPLTFIRDVRGGGDI